MEEAKRRLERTDQPIDKIAWAVGYADPAFFRRLFKRITRITPGAYRRKIPALFGAKKEEGVSVSEPPPLCVT